MVLDEYNVEIDEIDQHHVGLIIRALRLICWVERSAKHSSSPGPLSPRAGRKVVSTRLKVPRL